MLSTFGYMITLIAIKWTLDFEGENSSGAPSIINQMIELPLKAGGASNPLYGVD